MLSSREKFKKWVKANPYNYARDHARGPGAWCVRGQNGFYMPVPEKGLAFMIAALLRGDVDAAVAEAQSSVAHFDKYGVPAYLTEPSEQELKRREEALRAHFLEKYDMAMPKR